MEEIKIFILVRYYRLTDGKENLLLKWSLLKWFLFIILEQEKLYFNLWSQPLTLLQSWVNRDLPDFWIHVNFHIMFSNWFYHCRYWYHHAHLASLNYKQGKLVSACELLRIFMAKWTSTIIRIVSSKVAKFHADEMIYACWC